MDSVGAAIEIKKNQNLGKKLITMKKFYGKIEKVGRLGIPPIPHLHNRKLTVIILFMKQFRKNRQIFKFFNFTIEFLYKLL